MLLLRIYLGVLISYMYQYCVCVIVDILFMWRHWVYSHDALQLHITLSIVVPSPTLLCHSIAEMTSSSTIHGVAYWWTTLKLTGTFFFFWILYLRRKGGTPNMSRHPNKTLVIQNTLNVSSHVPKNKNWIMLVWQVRTYAETSQL